MKRVSALLTLPLLAAVILVIASHWGGGRDAVPATREEAVRALTRCISWPDLSAPRFVTSRSLPIQFNTERALLVEVSPDGRRCANVRKARFDTSQVGKRPVYALVVDPSDKARVFVIVEFYVAIDGTRTFLVTTQRFEHKGYLRLISLPRSVA